MDISKHRNFLLSEIKVNKPVDFLKFKKELIGFIKDQIRDDDGNFKDELLNYKQKIINSKNFQEITKEMREFYTDNDYVDELQNIIKKVI
jgi:hypothetical protein